MNIWIIFLLIGAAIVFLLDLLIRRKGWKSNTKEEKISLVLHMLAIGPYAFLSFLGMLWGLAGYSPETSFGEILYEITLTMGAVYFIIAIIAAILPFILRRLGKAKASIWITIIALAYIIVVLVVNTLVGKFL